MFLSISKNICIKEIYNKNNCFFYKKKTAIKIKPMTNFLNFINNLGPTNYTPYIISTIFSLILLLYIYNNFSLKKNYIINKNINFIETLITFLIIYSFMMFFISSFFEYLEYNNLKTITSVIENSQASSSNSNQDPNKWWPSGAPQTWGIIGSAIAAYRSVPGSKKTKAIAAFAAISVTAPLTVFTMAVEQPNGFNRLMYSWIEYHKTGTWPADIPNEITDNSISNKFESASSTKVEDYSDNSKTSLLGNNNFGDDFLNISFDSLFKHFISYFNLHPVEGYLNELYGFIWFSQVLLIIISIGLLFLFFIYIFINIFLLNKDLILKKLNNKNKLIQFYFKYQIILGYISFYFIPFLIIIGLCELIYILNYLITHPLPLESLDTQTYISTIKPK